MHPARDIGAEDPVLSMRGIGRQLWEQEPGDSFIERLRSEDPPPSPVTAQPGGTTLDLTEAVWRRIEGHQGEQFETARGLPFVHKVEGPGIWFYRNGEKVNRKLSRRQVEAAVLRCPLRTVTEISDLMDPSYLFGLLMDRRIRGEAW